MVNKYMGSWPKSILYPDTEGSYGYASTGNAKRVLAEEFFRAAETGDARRVATLLKTALPADYQDARNGETALHYAAASDAREVVRTLLATNRCNHLLRDKWGRLPSELAYLYGRDPALARLLAIKERKQAQREGIKLTRRPA